VRLYESRILGLSENLEKIISSKEIETRETLALAVEIVIQMSLNFGQECVGLDESGQNLIFVVGKVV
jgi:hypothetical protein